MILVFGDELQLVRGHSAESFGKAGIMMSTNQNCRKTGVLRPILGGGATGLASMGEWKCKLSCFSPLLVFIFIFTMPFFRFASV